MREGFRALAEGSVLTGDFDFFSARGFGVVVTREFDSSVAGGFGLVRPQPVTTHFRFSNLSSGSGNGIGQILSESGT